MPDCAALARLHAACFITPRPWSAAEIASLLDSPLTFALIESGGFLLGRVIADEAELLTIAVDPHHQRQGIGARLLHGFVTTAQDRGAATAFLEVAANNAAAIALYESQGFAQNGRRKAYYHAPQGQPVDALILSRSLTLPD